MRVIVGRERGLGMGMGMGLEREMWKRLQLSPVYET